MKQAKKKKKNIEPSFLLTGLSLSLDVFLII